MICGIRINLSRLRTVKICASRYMIHPFYGFYLILAALFKLFLLLSQAVLPDHIAKGSLSLYLHRQICHIDFGAGRHQPLNPNQRPLRLVKDLDRRKCMRKLRAKHMQNIRLIIIYDQFKKGFQLHIVIFRCVQIFHKGIAVAGNIFPQLHDLIKGAYGFLHWKSNSQFNTISVLLHDHSV